MPKVSKVSIQELVTASKKYVADQVKKADVNKNGLLSPTEAKGLAADLKDNFDASQFKLSWGSVRADDVAREFVVMMEAWARASDTNGDGYLSREEAKKLPRALRDNYVNYVSAQERKVEPGRDGEYQTRDVTPRAAVTAQERAYGPHAVSYADALERAIDAVATDQDVGLASFVAEFGGPDGYGLSDPEAIKAEVRELLAAGTIELVTSTEDLPFEVELERNWVFSVQTDGQGDHGLWAIVDRDTASVEVTNFN